MDLISDPSCRVCQAAFQSLGPFLSTFVNPCSSGQLFKVESKSSKDKNRFQDQDIPEDGQIGTEAVPLDLSITNSSVKLGNTLKDGTAEICSNSSGKISIPVDSSFESHQEAASNENDENLGNYQSAFQPKVGTSSQDYTFLGKKLSNSIKF
jgi:serine/threonine-protein phosphatase 4 regulatory subunit 1